MEHMNIFVLQIYYSIVKNAKKNAKFFVEKNKMKDLGK